MRSRLLVALGIIAVSLLVIPLTASGDEGRPGSSTPGFVEGPDSVGVPGDIGTDDVDGNQRDQVILDDLIVDGSICAGFDCVNGESFGFDTLRLKENNLRIKFQDTSTSASFPSNDWQLTINDSTNGGQNKFSIDDISGGRTPFTIEASAPSHSVYVDDGGRLGLGTSTPVVDIHTKSGNTPTLRLEQDGSSGFTPQTFDVAANEANFFIRDATNGSTLPFRLRPGAPTDSIEILANGSVELATEALRVDFAAPDRSLDVASDGKVGIGTEGTVPGVQLHVSGDDVGNGSTNTTALTVENTSATKKPRHMVYIVNNGASTISFEDTSTINDWFFGTTLAGDFRVGYQSLGNPLEIDKTGEITAIGDINAAAFNVTSDRTLKAGITPVNASDVLAAVSDLQVSTWTFAADEAGTLHLGPMAQDFAAAFGVGDSDTSINLGDAVGVSFASIQALAAENDALEARIAQLEAQVADLLASQG